MGLLDWFKEKPKKEEQGLLNGETPTRESFVEEKEINFNNSEDLLNSLKGLQKVKNYIHHSRKDDGYRDALSNPTYSYMSDNLNLLVVRLESLIDDSIFYYETIITETEFKIKDCELMGFLSEVGRLESDKSQFQKAIEKLKLMLAEKESKELGPFYQVKESYRLGFQRGVSEQAESINTIKQ